MIIITGATKGIGRAISEKLSLPGKKILAIARTHGQLQEMQQEWAQRFPEVELHTLPTDLATEEGCEELRSYLRQHRIVPSVLVNNLGVFEPGGLLGRMNVFENLLATNLLAAHRVSRIVLPAMLKARVAGQLITIGSVATNDIEEDTAAYAASKGALEAWHKALSVNLKKTSLRFSLLIPGATLTASWEGAIELPENILRPQQIAEAVAFLLDLPANSEIPSLVIRPK